MLPYSGWKSAQAVKDCLTTGELRALALTLMRARAIMAAMRFGDLVRSKRKAQRLTISQLAHLLGVDMSTLWRLELGRSKPSVETIRRLSDVLGLPVDELLVGLE